ncbi:MAG: hypothetical protein WCC59_18315 [Terriglobales bacterium]
MAAEAAGLAAEAAGLAAGAAVPGAVPVVAGDVVDDGPPSAAAGSAGFFVHAIINAITKITRLHSNSVRRIKTSTVGNFLPKRAPDGNATGRQGPIGQVNLGIG